MFSAMRCKERGRIKFSGVENHIDQKERKEKKRYLEPLSIPRREKGNGGEKKRQRENVGSGRRQEAGSG